MSYSRTAISGLAWVTAGRVAVRSATIAKTIFLARLLTPAEFGLFGVAALILTLLEILTETGINVFLIQEKSGLEDYLDTAFITSILRGLVISLSLVVLAGPVSLFFQVPESSGLIKLSALVPLLRGFINPAVISLQKRLRFGREFVLRSAITAVELAVAVVVGLATQSAAALVWSMIASALAEVLFTNWWISPRPALIWSPRKFLRILSSGKWVTLSGIFNYLFQEGDDIAVGKLIDTVSLGLYQTAYKIAILPLSEIVDIFGRVTFPLYSQIATDVKELRRLFLRASLAIVSLTFPIALIIMLVPEAILHFLLGPAWTSAAPALRILAVFALIRTIAGSSSALFLATKRQHLVTAMTMSSLVGLLLTIWPLIHTYGLVGAAFSALIGAVAAIPVVLFGLWTVLIPPHAPRKS